MAFICPFCGVQNKHEDRVMVCGACCLDRLPVMTEEIVNHPKHYTKGDIECIDAMEANASPEEFKGYLRLAAFKYLWRCRYKGAEKKDIMKAIWYLEKYLKELDS